MLEWPFMRVLQTSGDSEKGMYRILCIRTENRHWCPSLKRRRCIGRSQFREFGNIGPVTLGKGVPSILFKIGLLGLSNKGGPTV